MPDLVTAAKGIAGGMPLAAVTGRADLMDAVHPGGLGGTYGGNPVACAAALAAVETMEQEDLAGRARAIGEVLTDRLGRLAEKYDEVGEVRGRGAMIAIELVEPGTGDTTKKPNAAAVSAIADYAAQHGVLLLTAGTYGNVLRFLPSLALSDELIHDALSVIDDAMAAL